MRTPVVQLLAGVALGANAASTAAIAYEIHDERIYAFGAYDYENPEFSIDGRFAVILRTDMATGVMTITLYTVDPVNGDLHEKCSYGVPSNGRAWPQWGHSDVTGHYAVAFDRAKKNFIVVNAERPCNEVFQRIPVRYPADLGPHASTGASMPMPAKGGISRRWVAIPWDNRWVPNGGDKELMLFQDLDDRTSEAIRTEPTAYPADREPGNSVTAPRWRAPFRRVTRQEVFYGRWNAALTRIDVVSRPFTDSGPGSEVVVVDTMTAVDAYPFAFGQKYLIAGVNNAASGVLLVFKDGHYNTVATGIPYDPYEPPQTSFPPPPEGAPAYALSFENFVWNGHLYASYHVSDKNERGPNCGMPSCLATEIWVVRFDNTDPDSLTVAGLCRVSGIVGDVVPPEPNRFLSLMDPEPVVVQDGAILYYNRTNIDTGLGELWRIRLGTEPEFAAACAAPENLVVVENPET